MSREQILGNIRRALKRGAPADTAPLETRLREAPTGPIPARGQLPRAQRIELFLEMAKRASASVVRVASGAEVPAAVAEFLARENLPACLKLAPDPALTGLPWETRPLIEISTGATAGDDPVSLGHAEAGIAETGTLMLASGPQSPSTLNFLPETEIVLLPAERVVGGMEEAWALLRGRLPAGAMPRTVNLITGPSRSADIGQKIQLGAHGPRRLHIIVVGE
jgi:L-lactate dehydrogenase complex protein LldG